MSCELLVNLIILISNSMLLIDLHADDPPAN